jgi:hypothetical protein
MHADAAVETPLWRCKNLAAYASELEDAQRFLRARAEPALTILSQRTLRDGRVAIGWVLAVEWPAPWRPRINILGESTLTLESRLTGTSLVSHVSETWHQSPMEAFRTQMLPRFRDFASIWNTPTAEHVPWPLVSQGDGFELRRMPPFLAIQSEWTETGGMLYAEQAPIAPSYAFNGEVKRSEWYSAVSPGMLERSYQSVSLPDGTKQTGQRRCWISPLPGRFSNDLSSLPDLSGAVDDPNAPLPASVSDISVQYVRRPAQLLAVRRLRKIPSNELVRAPLCCPRPPPLTSSTIC